MFKMNWAKIDKFYPILVGVMVLLAVLFILTFRNIFSAFQTAYELEPGLTETESKIDRSKLDDSYNFVFDREATNTGEINGRE